MGRGLGSTQPPFEKTMAIPSYSSSADIQSENSTKKKKLPSFRSMIDLTLNLAYH